MKKGKPQENPDDYEVGYGKPPKHTRFQPGRSGNPRGRPKGTNNLKTDLIEELDERILVREGEKTRRVSKQRAVLKTVVTRSLKGDARAMNSLLSLMLRLLDTSAESDVAAPLNDDERELLKAYETRLRRRDAAATPPVGEAGARERSPS